jgi:putative hydrolase of the HAD superfamily
MPSSLRVVLCDLDDTLFDHIHATRAALDALRAHAPELACWSLDELDVRHRDLLERLHLEVLRGQMTIAEARDERFGTLLRDAGGDSTVERAHAVAMAYRSTYETVWQPVPGAVALSEAIRRAGLKLVIVTNNVVVEQQIKLQRCGLSMHVDALIASEEAGFQKPDVRIFEIALSRAGATVDEAVMLGDAWATDIEGARAAGIRAVWLNRNGLASPDPSVAELRSLEPVADAMKVIYGAEWDRVWKPAVSSA